MRIDASVLATQISGKKEKSMNVIATEKAPAAIGPYSQGCEINGLVFTSGQIPIVPETGAAPEGIEAQADQSCRGAGGSGRRV